MSQKNVIVCDYCGKECQPGAFLNIIGNKLEKVFVQTERQQWGFSRIDLCSVECATEFFKDKFYKGPKGGT